MSRATGTVLRGPTLWIVVLLAQTMGQSVASLSSPDDHSIYSRPSSVIRRELEGNQPNLDCPKSDRMCLSATNRLPSEIWEEILDRVIDIPFFFDLGCTLDDFYDWTAKQIEISNGAIELYACSERQRRVLRLVCHSWKTFADSQADRLVYGNQLPARSLQVYIDHATKEHYTQETRWEMVGLLCRPHPITREYGAPLLRLAENHEKHSKIQRISLVYQFSWISPKHSNPLLNSLAAFSNLRTLHFNIDVLKAPLQPIVLSRLTSLRWSCRSFFRRPHECLILPSLISLSVPIMGYTHDSATLVAPYRRTLKHLILGNVGDEGPNEAAVDSWTLPPWENYPHLVELAIDTIRTSVPSVPCPPLNHPIKAFRIPKWDSKSVVALLGHESHPNHLERIIMTRLQWRDSVVLPANHVGAVGDHHLENDVMSIIHLCSERGVRLEDGLHQTIQGSDRVTWIGTRSVRY